MRNRLSVLLALMPLVVAGCTTSGALAPKPEPTVAPLEHPHDRIDGLITKYAAENGVPESLVRRVVARESGFNPKCYHRGNWGLMQIKAATARTMGYDGPAKGLLDPETNLKYGVRYLRGAWIVAHKNENRAIAYYASGYYYRAKRMGLLDETGLKS